MLIRAQCAWAGDATSGAVAAEDLIMITPHFWSSGGAPSFANLANSLHDMMAKSADVTSWSGAAVETRVNLYDRPLAGGKTGPPVYTSTKNAGVFAVSNYPREVAACLSFYGQQNQPSYRGRLYFPWCFRPTGNNPVARPTQAQRDFVLTMADKLAAAGGAEWAWSVYSPKRQNFVGVTHAWCDDEWDTQRRRGLRKTTRSEKDIVG